jgi:hypothetical protein
MMWTATLMMLAGTLAVFAAFRCRRANKLIARILVEELGPQPRTDWFATMPPQTNHTRLATDQLVISDHN